MIRTLTPIFSIVTALLIFFFFTQPRFTEITHLQQETEEYEAAVAKASELNVELSTKLAEKRSHAPEVLEKLNAIVPNEINEIVVLNDLSKIAESNNLLFGNVTVVAAIGDESEGEYMEGFVEGGTEEEVDALEMQDFTFELIGTYDQFKAFLSDLEKSLVTYEILNIDFGNEGEGLFQQYSITTRVFALPGE